MQLPTLRIRPSPNQLSAVPLSHRPALVRRTIAPLPPLLQPHRFVPIRASISRMPRVRGGAYTFPRLRSQEDWPAWMNSIKTHLQLVGLYRTIRYLEDNDNQKYICNCPQCPMSTATTPTGTTTITSTDDSPSKSVAAPTQSSSEPLQSSAPNNVTAVSIDPGVGSKSVSSSDESDDAGTDEEQLEALQWILKATSKDRFVHQRVLNFKRADDAWRELKSTYGLRSMATVIRFATEWAKLQQAPGESAISFFARIDKHVLRARAFEIYYTKLDRIVKVIGYTLPIQYDVPRKLALIDMDMGRILTYEQLCNFFMNFGKGSYRPNTESRMRPLLQHTHDRTGLLPSTDAEPGSSVGSH